jgi:hypothetical protein
MSSRVNLGEIVKAQGKAQGYELGPKCCAIMGLSAITGLTLFIIGCVGAAGAFPGSAIGWVTVGLAGGGFALNLAVGNLEKRKVELIVGALVAAVLITVGALGGTGLLSTIQVGWGIIGASLASLPVSCVAACLKGRHIEQVHMERKFIFFSHGLR